MFTYIYNYLFPSTPEGSIEGEHDVQLKYNDERFNTKILVKPKDDGKLGCFATQDIQQGWYVRYHGEFTQELPENDLSWPVTTFDEKTGNIVSNSTVIGYVDGSTSNDWTKYVGYTTDYDVGCVSVGQYGMKIYYYFYRDVAEGEEIMMPCEQEWMDYLLARD